MSELLRIKNLIKKIRDKSEYLSGGSGDKSRYIMRDPDLYWKLGEVLEELFEKNNISEKERQKYIVEKLTKVEKEVWPRSGVGLCINSYKVKYHFIKKERFDTVKMLAGHKFKNFRFKRVTYLLNNFSKRRPNATEEQQDEMIKVFSKKDYSHDAFVEAKQKILGVLKIDQTKIQEDYDQVLQLVQDGFDGNSNKRDELRKSIGTNYFEPISWLLQLIKVVDEQKLVSMYKPKIKSRIKKDYKSKHKFLDSFYSELRSCLGDFEKIPLLHQIIPPHELSDLNSKLKALESEDKFELYQSRKEALKTIFS